MTAPSRAWGERIIRPKSNSRSGRKRARRAFHAIGSSQHRASSLFTCRAHSMGQCGMMISRTARAWDGERWGKSISMHSSTEKGAVAGLAAWQARSCLSLLNIGGAAGRSLRTRWPLRRVGT